MSITVKFALRQAVGLATRDAHRYGAVPVTLDPNTCASRVASRESNFTRVSGP